MNSSRSLLLIEVELIYSIALISNIQQGDSFIHICIYSFSYSFPVQITTRYCVETSVGPCYLTLLYIVACIC